MDLNRIKQTQKQSTEDVTILHKHGLCNFPCNDKLFELLKLCSLSLWGPNASLLKAFHYKRKLSRIGNDDRIRRKGKNH